MILKSWSGLDTTADTVAPLTLARGSETVFLLMPPLHNGLCAGAGVCTPHMWLNIQDGCV